MRKSGIGSHTRPNNGATVKWLTPPEIVNALGPFDFDPCAAPSPRPWETAIQCVELPEDGLNAKWKGFVWMNPPYGTETGKWLNRLADHGSGIALVFARTETKMFQKSIWPVATALRFIFGRPHFYTTDGKRAKGNSGGPLVLVAYGGEARYRLSQSSIPGQFVDLMFARPEQSRQPAPASKEKR